MATPSANMPGQLGQLRYIVERGVHEPEIVAVVETGELEQEQDQSRSDHRWSATTLTEGAQDQAGGQRRRRDVGRAKQSPTKRFPRQQRRGSTIIDPIRPKIDGRQRWRHLLQQALRAATWQRPSTPQVRSG